MCFFFQSKLFRIAQTINVTAPSILNEKAQFRRNPKRFRLKKKYCEIVKLWSDPLPVPCTIQRFLKVNKKRVTWLTLCRDILIGCNLSITSKNPGICSRSLLLSYSFQNLIDFSFNQTHLPCDYEKDQQFKDSSSGADFATFGFYIYVYSGLLRSLFSWIWVPR